DPLVEVSMLAQNPGEIKSRHHGWKPGEAEPFPAQIAFEQPEHLLEEILGPSEITRAQTGLAEVEARPGHERNISKRLGDGQSVLAEHESVARMARDPEVVTHVH